MLCRSCWMMLPVLSAAVALAQPSKPDPVEAALQEVYRLHQEGDYNGAAAKRDEARALLDRMPLTAQNWFRVQRVTQLYEQAGRSATVRAILQSALARSASSGDASLTRVQLASVLANSWRGDGNLLQAAGVLEGAVSAVEAAAAAKSARTPATDPVNLYEQLARVYRDLGRPQAAEAMIDRAVARLQDNPSALAGFYEREGRAAEAAALYRKLADEAQDPQQASGLLQSLARVLAMDERPAEAAAAMQTAIDRLQAAPHQFAVNQIPYLRQTLAGYLQQAGNTAQAEEVYRLVVSESSENASQAVTSYSQFLNSTERNVQAQSVLGDYLENHPGMPDWQKANLLYNLAGMTNDPQKSERYRQEAQKKQLSTVNNNQDPVSELLQQAQNAAGKGQGEEAYSFTLQAIAAASSGKHESLNFGMVMAIASGISPKQPARAEQIYENLIAAAESWSNDTVRLLEQALSLYVRSLSSRPERRGAASAAIERYRKVVSEASGDDAGAAKALDLTILLERGTGGSPERLLALQQERLRMEESRNGPTSRPYLSALQNLASTYEQACNSAQALPLYQQAIAIVDLVSSPRDQQRVWERMNQANRLAAQRQFAEAERLAGEAVALAAAARLRIPNLQQQLDSLRQAEKRAPQKPASAASCAPRLSPRPWIEDVWYR